MLIPCVQHGVKGFGGRLVLLTRILLLVMQINSKYRPKGIIFYFLLLLWWSLGLELVWDVASYFIEGINLWSRLGSLILCSVIFLIEPQIFTVGAVAITAHLKQLSMNRRGYLMTSLEVRLVFWILFGAILEFDGQFRVFAALLFQDSLHRGRFIRTWTTEAWLHLIRIRSIAPHHSIRLLEVSYCLLMRFLPYWRSNG
jgi:hypothetical protein